jgi:hypothetical protein
MSHKQSPSIRLSTFATFANRALTLGLLGLSLTACNEHDLDGVAMEGASEQPISFDFAPQNKVDVLIVLDNSGSMGEEQANLASNFGAFVEELEGAGADYRLAVTTTDVFNPHWCGSTDAENGSLQASSCRERLSAFTSQSGATNVQDIACTDICELDELGLRPTRVEGGDGAEVRPWIQVGGAESNLPEGVTGTQAFSCMAPQGIDGCGFESPLEALRLALLRMQNPSEPEFGFLRDDAELSVIIVTDEVDCSTSDHGDTIFDAQGSKVFWSDPDSGTPTSAICWNAGVRCTGDASSYDDCVAVDKDADGNDSEPAGAVLRPVEEYIELIDGIANTKATGKKVHVSLLGGVPQDFDPSMGVPYAQSGDAEFQSKFGIGAGCTSEVNGVVQEAVPPVRMAELVEAYDGTQMFSVCEDDYTPALTNIVERLTPGLRGACVEHCLADQDGITPGIQPECRFTEVYEDGTKQEVPDCEQQDGAWTPPAGFDACIAYLGDVKGESSSIIDDPDLYCGDTGFMAVELWRVEGSTTPEGSKIEATCSADVRGEMCG